MDNDRKVNFELFNWEADKPFFATYFNLAQHNLKQILDNINLIVFNKKSDLSEDALHADSNVIKKLKAKEPDQEAQSIINLLEKWLPFAIEGISNNPNDVGNRLRTYAYLLDCFRNSYSHYENEPPPLHFTDVKNKGKKQKQPSGSQRYKIKQGDWIELKERAKEKLLKRYQLTDKTYAPLVAEEAMELSKCLEENLNTAAKMSEKDVLLFLCLFLERRDVHALLNHIQGMKNTSWNPFRLNREFFCSYCCKLPQDKLLSANKQTSFLLNVIGELNRCPQLVKHNMKEAYKPLLVVKEEAFEVEETSDTDFLTQQVELVRHGDRFPFLALQFGELFHYFKGLKFHLNLGTKYNKAPYSKLIFDKEVQRELKSDILTFGQLNTYESRDQLTDETNPYPDYIRLSEEQIETLPPLHHYKPHYHFSEGRIAFVIDGAAERIIPDVGYGAARPYAQHKMYFLSLNEVPHFIATCIGYGGAGKLIGTIREFERNFYHLLDEVIDQKLKAIPVEFITPKAQSDWLQKTYKLKLSWLPAKVKHYLQNNNSSEFKKKTIAKLEKWKTESEALERAIDLSPEEWKEDKDYFPFYFKKGNLATWLARDIVKLCKAREVVKNGVTSWKKLNSSEYQMLQGKLAYFNLNLGILEDLFLSLGLTMDTEYAHPFLHNVSLDKVKVKGKERDIGLTKYFKRYLGERQNWLSELINAVQQDRITESDYEDELHFLPFSPKDLDTGFAAIKNYAENLKTRPLFVPRGLFNPVICQSPKLPTSGIDAEKDNLVYFINQHLGGQHQWFYDHEIIDWPENRKEKHQLDKKIRQQLTIDSVLWLMLKHFQKETKVQQDEGMQQLKEHLNNLTLSDFRKPEASGELTNIMESKVKLSVKLKTGKVVVDANRKLRDYGALRRYLKDKRIPGILNYYEAPEIEVGVVKQELEQYEKLQFPLLKKVFDVEKIFKEKAPDLFNTLKAENEGYVKFSALIEKIPDVKHKKELIDFRNKMLHNQFPQNIAIAYEEGKVVEKVLEKGIEWYTTLLKQMEQKDFFNALEV